MRIPIRIVGRAERRDVLLDATAGSTIGALMRALQVAPGGRVRVDGRVASLQARIADSLIHSGSTISVHDIGADSADVDLAGIVDLGIASGTHAGKSIRLGPGQHSVGGSHGDALLDGIPDGALLVRVDPRGRVEVRVTSPGIDAELAGTRIGEDWTSWPADALLTILTSMLQHRRVREADAVAEYDPETGTFSFNRPPRIAPVIPEGTFRLPAPPQMLAKSAIPWLTVAAPLLIGVVMALVLRSPAYLAFAVLSPVVALVNVVTGRRQGRKSHRQKVDEHQRLVERIQNEVAARQRAESAVAIAASPSAATLLAIAVAPESALWQRRPDDRDHLQVRVGVADVLSKILVEDLREPLEYQQKAPTLLPRVPATIRLDEVGVLGFAGDIGRASGSAAWAIGQLAVLQSPKDVACVVLAASNRDGDPGPGHDWSWTAWLPHAAPFAGQDARTLVGNDADTIGRRIAELSQLIDDRQAARRNTSGRVRTAPDVVVVLDGARRLRSFPGVPAILRDGPAVGVYAICVDESERALPEECGAVLVHRSDGTTVLRRSEREAVQGITADDVDPAWFDTIGRGLAALRDTGEEQDDVIPVSARLTDVLQLEPLTPDRITGRWAGSGRSTSAVVGVGFDGPFSLDLVSDGPHGLIAGTTGAGKSELLQTLIASLAVANRPDMMNFVLIDYKGGAAFKDAVQLPHTVGMVTDLDAHLVERALTSLGAELTRREHLLAAAAAKDIDDYVDLLGRDGTLTPMPRLVIVIDEFASMARELPDFVSGLVNIAQRGRSLGIHLILATQRPSGVVSGEIRANTNLRIALRVTDAADSSDVIDAPDAARIAASTPGRAYVRLGHSSLMPFQTARVGGRSPEVSQGDEQTLTVSDASWATAGYPSPVLRVEAADHEVTDLRRLVDAASSAARSFALPVPHRPWLPPLPVRIIAEDLTAGRSHSRDALDTLLPAVAWALSDVPQRQAQEPVLLDLSTFGHMFLAGTARSGRSQALRTIGASLARAVAARDVHLFGIDMGNGALLPLTRLPHTGAVVQRNERDRVMRLLDRLQAELTRRQEQLSRLGVADIGEQRSAASHDDRLAHLVVLIDRWESFVSTYGDQDAGALIERIHVLLREGASAGIHLVIAGDRSLLSGRISVLTEDKWLLRAADRSDFSMGGLNPRKLPDHIGDGRAFHATTGLEAQIALLDEDVSAVAQAAAIDRIVAETAARDRDLDRDHGPMRIDVLPTTLSLADLDRYPEPPHGQPWMRLGIGGDELEVVGADLSTGNPSFLVAGPARSGRSSMLASIVATLLRDEVPVVLFCPRPTLLLDRFGKSSGVRAIFDRADVEPDALAQQLDVAGPVVLVVDDAELVRDVPARETIRSFLRAAAGGGRALVVAGNAAEIGGGFGGWQTDVKNGQRGALLSPRNIFDGDLIGVRVSRSATGLPVTPGRALVNVGDGVPRVIQVPQP